MLELGLGNVKTVRLQFNLLQVNESGALQNVPRRKLLFLSSAVIFLHPLTHPVLGPTVSTSRLNSALICKFCKFCKIFKFVATRCQILRLKCTTFNFGSRWGSLQRSPDPLAGFKGPTSKGGRERDGKRECWRGDVERKGKGREEEVSGGREREGTPKVGLHLTCSKS